MKFGKRNGAKSKKYKGLLFILGIREMTGGNLIDEIGEG